MRLAWSCSSFANLPEVQNWFAISSHLLALRHLAAIVFFGSLVRKITKTFHIDRCRGANILDGVACGATGLMPHGNPVNVVLGVVLTLENFDPNFSFLNILPYNFHCWGLLILFLLSILTGIGRKFEAEESAEEETVNA